MHCTASQSVILSSEENLEDISPHLLLGGATKHRSKHWSLVGGWVVGSSHLTHGGWKSTGKQLKPRWVKALVTGGWVVHISPTTHGGWMSTGKQLTHRRTVTDPLHARSSPRTRTWPSILTTKIRKLLTKRKYLSEILTRRYDC